MGTTMEGASYQVLTIEDMKMLEEIASRIINARGQQFQYMTDAGVKVTFDPPVKLEDVDEA